jgi:hypothetical protein
MEGKASGEMASLDDDSDDDDPFWTHTNDPTASDPHALSRCFSRAPTFFPFLRGDVARLHLFAKSRLTQAQVLYINFDFPTFSGVNLRHESKLGCTRIQKLLGFEVFIFAII